MDAPAFHSEPSLCKQPDRPPVELMLLLQHSCCERLRRVVVLHRHDGLKDNGAMVVLLIHEVNGDPGELGP